MVTPKTEQSGTLYLVDWSYDEDDQRFEDVVCELEGYPGWLIRPDIATTEQGLLVRRLAVEPGNGMPPHGITTRMLRQIRTGDLIAALRAARRQYERYVGPLPDLSPHTRVGRRGRDDLDYAKWAAQYVEALRRSGRPVEDLAARHNVSASHIRNLMHACRRRGVLTASPPGRAGGELTDYAVRLLEGA